MLNSLDPKEKKAILLFFGFLILGVVYLTTHQRPREEPSEIESSKKIPEGSQRKYSYEKYF